MSTIEQNLRVTLLSLKQISDRIKSVLNKLGAFNGTTVESKLNALQTSVNAIPTTQPTDYAKEETSAEIYRFMTEDLVEIIHSTAPKVISKEHIRGLFE